MVWMSTTWRRWEKWVGTLTAPVVTLGVVFIPHWIAASGAGAEMGAGSEMPNPLVPALFDTWWSGILFLLALNAIVGLWLLWRGLARNGAPLR